MTCIAGLDTNNPDLDLRYSMISKFIIISLQELSARDHENPEELQYNPDLDLRYNMISKFISLQELSAREDYFNNW